MQFQSCLASVSPLAMIGKPGAFRTLRSQRSAREENARQSHSQVNTNLSIHHLSSYPSFSPGPGPTDCHRVTPAHSDFSIPPACHQPPPPFRGVPTAQPAAPHADVFPASHSFYISSVGHHPSKRQCCQPWRGGWRDAHQWPLHTQPHQHRVQARRQEKRKGK